MQIIRLGQLSLIQIIVKFRLIGADPNPCLENEFRAKVFSVIVLFLGG